MPLSAPGKFKTDANNNSYGGSGIGVGFLPAAVNNTLVGYQAGAPTTTATKNTIIGAGAGLLITQTSENTVVGSDAYPSATSTPSLGRNVVIGAKAAPLYVGAAGTIIGHNAGNTLTSQNSATLIGANAGNGYSSTITCVGADAGTRTNSSTATGNTFIGYSSGGSSINATISQCTAVGQGSLGNGNASETVAIGVSAALGGLSGSLVNCVVIGNSAGASHIATDSVFIGHLAGLGQGASSRSVAIGSKSLDNIANGSDNVAVGYNTLTAANTGKQNVVVGSGAGATVNGASADNNVLIGYNTGSNLTTGGGNILIGAGVTATSASASNEVKIGALLLGSQTLNDKTALIDAGIQFRRTPYATTGSTLDETIIGCTASNITLTVPSSMIARSGRVFIIKDESGTASGVSAITVNCQGGQLIDGAASVTIVTAYGALRLYSNGTNLFTF